MKNNKQIVHDINNTLISIQSFLYLKSKKKVLFSPYYHQELKNKIQEFIPTNNINTYKEAFYKLQELKNKYEKKS